MRDDDVKLRELFTIAIPIGEIEVPPSVRQFLAAASAAAGEVMKTVFVGFELDEETAFVTIYHEPPEPKEIEQPVDLPDLSPCVCSHLRCHHTNSEPASCSVCECGDFTLDTRLAPVVPSDTPPSPPSPYPSSPPSDAVLRIAEAVTALSPSDTEALRIAARAWLETP